MWGYTQCKLLDPSNHLYIQTCTLQVEEDKKNMSRMQTLMDNLQLKVQSYKQQIESAVSAWGSCSLMDFLAIYIWLMEICGPELKRQLVREDQLSLKSAHSLSLFFLMCMLELSPIVKICATFPFREPKLSPLTFAYTQTYALCDISQIGAWCHVEIENFGWVIILWGFSCGSVVKNPGDISAGDVGSNSEWGRSPGARNGNPL